MSEESRSWHLDRRFPIAIIMAIAVQTGGAIWWAAKIDSSATEAAKERSQLVERIARIESERDSLLDRMTRMEVRLENLTASSAEILRILRAQAGRRVGAGKPKRRRADRQQRR